MKFVIALVLTAALALIAPVYLPWYSIAFAAFLVALLIPQKPMKAFLTAFLAVFLLWGIYAFIKDSQNESLLSAKIARLMKLGDNSFALVAITGFVGGLVAGFAGLTGSLLRSIFRKK